MRPQLAASDGPCVTGESIGLVTTAPTGRRRASDSTLWKRITRIIGRALHGLPPSTWLLVDVAILSAGVFWAFQAFPPPSLLVTPHIVLWQALAVFAFALTISSLVFGLYERETWRGRSRIVTRMLLTCAATIVIAYAVIYVVMYATVSRRVTCMAMAVFMVGSSGIRFCAYWAIHKVRRCLLVVGPQSLYQSFVKAQEDGLLGEYRLAGYATPGSREGTDADEPADKACLGAIADRLGVIDESGVTDIVVGKTAARDPRVMEWMVPCLQCGCRVTNEAIFYEKATGQILVDEITPSWFLFADLKVHCDEQATFKRLIDLGTAIVGLVLSAPLWPLIAAVIKLGDGGPVLYSQDRVGQHGRIFRLFKFRTMRVDAENGKSIWASQNDPRVTTVGRFLRKSRLDELPQLYNVLLGQMSIIGPRPERPDIVADLTRKIPYYAERHLVKPGVSGWAQISFRYGASVEDSRRKLQFDLYYLKHMSFELDMVILFRTVSTFLRGAC